MGSITTYHKYDDLLKKSGKSTYEVCKATGLNASMLSHWKHGLYTPKADKLAVLADYFGVELSYFYKV